MSTYYQRLNVDNLAPWLFNRKLLAFAIDHRLQRASNHLHVATQIVELHLVDTFITFAAPHSSDLPQR